MNNEFSDNFPPDESGIDDQPSILTEQLNESAKTAEKLLHQHIKKSTQPGVSPKSLEDSAKATLSMILKNI